MYEYSTDFVQVAMQIQQCVDKPTAIWQKYNNDCWYYTTMNNEFCVAFLRSQYGQQRYKDLYVVRYDRNLQQWCVSKLFNNDYVGALEYINNRCGYLVLNDVLLSDVIYRNIITTQEICGTYREVQQKYKVWNLKNDLDLKLSYELLVDNENAYKSTKLQQQSLRVTRLYIDVDKHYVYIEATTKIDMKGIIKELLQNKRVGTGIGFTIPAKVTGVRKKYKAKDIYNTYMAQQGVQIYASMLDSNNILCRYEVQPNNTHNTVTVKHGELQVQVVVVYK